MKRILVGGAGGTPSNGFIQSLREAPEPFYIIGMTCIPYDLCKAKVDECHLDPYAIEPDYYDVLEDIIQETKPDFIHVQNDAEVFAISRFRDRLAELGVRTYLPAHETVTICQDKFKSFEKWKAADLPVAETMLIRDESDLKRAFAQLGPMIWIRATTGAWGRGSLPTHDFEMARAWINFFDGWGCFVAAQCLERDTVTWLSIWRDGELVVAQGRKRLYWEFANRTLSGVTGITGTGVTISDIQVDEIAQKSILAVDPKPHGIFGVDLTCDQRGIPNPTEINIGRFFTTHLFFTRAGLNMPYILVKLAFDEPLPYVPRRLNPLTPGLAWVRGMDTEPVLTTMREIENIERELAERRERLGSVT